MREVRSDCADRHHAVSGALPGYSAALSQHAQTAARSVALQIEGSNSKTHRSTSTRPTSRLEDAKQPLLVAPWVKAKSRTADWSTTQPFARHLGLRSTTITLSPRKNILLMKRSLFTGLAFCLPLPVFGTSVHISFTFSKTMLQCLSKALQGGGRGAVAMLGHRPGEAIGGGACAL